MLARMFGAPDIVSGLQFIEESEDDEWSALSVRFEQEGLHALLPVEEKLLHVWRWLGDAEHNLKTSRKMLDKQRIQQSQELREVELFVGKLKEITDERVRKVEEEKQNLELEMEDLKSHSNTDINLNEIAGMLRQEGLHNIIHCSLSEQVAYLLVERARLMEEIVMEKERHKGLTANLTDNVKLSSPQMHEIMEQLKADYEKQLRHQKQHAIRSAEQMRKSHEDELRQLRQDLQDSKKAVELLSNANTNTQQSPSQIQELRNKISELTERIRKMEKAMRQLENENETLIYKLSEALTECDEKETLLRNIRMTSVASSRRNSRIISPRQVSSRDTSEERRRNEATAEEIRKLSSDVERFQNELLQSKEKYELLATKYERRKQQQRKRVDKQKELHQKELNVLKDKMKRLQEEVAMTRVALQSERTHRDKVLSNMAELAEENKKLSNRLFETEDIMKEKARNLSLLNLRVSYLEKEKVQLTEQTKTPRLSIDSTASIDPKSQSESTEVLEKLSHAITSMRSSVTPSTSANTPNQGTPTSQTPRTPQSNTIVRPHLLRWFSQPESLTPPNQQQTLQRSTLTNTFGVRLETLLNNIDQLRTIVVASAGNLTHNPSA